MRKHVRSEGKENGRTQHLKAKFAPLAVNFAERERGFRTMNAILTKQRASLLFKTVSATLLYMLWAHL